MPNPFGFLPADADTHPTTASDIMKCPRRKLPLIVPIVLLAVTSIWIALSRAPVETKSVPAEVTVGGLTEDERRKLRNRGILVLPGAQNTMIVEKGNRIKVEYRLDVEDSPEDLIEAFRVSLTEMGWTVASPHGLAGMLAKNQNRDIAVDYYVLDGDGPLGTPPGTGLLVGALSIELPRPTPTPQLRPIS